MTITLDGTNGIDSPDLNITGTNARITGDFSNATIADRVMFQTSTVNGNTSLELLPNGTSVASVFSAGTSSSDPANASIMQVGTDGTTTYLNSNRRGTGTYLPMLFYTNGSERMRIDTSGNLLVGTTTSPTYGKFATNGGSQVWTFGPDTGNSFVVYCQPTVGGNYGVYVAAGATSWTANSDERLKDITGNIEDALASIQSLRAVKYTLKADEQENKTQRVGLIAQDVQVVFPEIVDQNSDGYLGIRYSEVVPFLVAAIKELSAKNDALEARIAALEGVQ